MSPRPRHDLGGGYEVAEDRPGNGEVRRFLLFHDGRAIGGFASPMWTVTGDDLAHLTVEPSLCSHATRGLRPAEHHGYIRDGRWVDA